MEPAVGGSGQGAGAMKRLWRKLTRRWRMEAEMKAEMEFHREMAERNGDVIPFGNLGVVQEEARDVFRFVLVENLWRDLVYAVRMLLRSPGFTLSALLSLGLGIGVNTTVFSLGMELLASDPSVTDVGNLVRINLGGNSHSNEKIYREVERAGLFAALVGEQENTGMNWDNGVETRRVFTTEGTENYFEALGIPLAQGRGWNATDKKEVVVLSHGFWQKHLGGKADVLGSTLRLDGRVYTVIGVLPEGHRVLTGMGLTPELFVPKYIDGSMLAIYARLKPGMERGQVIPMLLPLATRLEKELPQGYELTKSTKVIPVGGFARVKVDPGALGVFVFFGVMLVLVGMVLLIACVNVAGLLLARASARKQEIAIRLSLGAGRGRLLQQLLVESLLLSSMGAVLGFALAMITARSLAAVQLPLPVPIQLHVEADWRVVSYSAVLAVLAAMVSGFAPAWQAVKRNVSGDLRKEQRMRGRRILVAVQVAVAFVVLATAALFVTNLVRVQDLGPGFDVQHTLRAGVNLPPRAYTEGPKVEEYTRRVLREMEAVPGTEAVAAAILLPFLDMSTRGGSITVEGASGPVPVRYHVNSVTSGYFATLGIPLKAGRLFEERDRKGGHAVVVNEEFVRRYLAGRAAVGSAFRWGLEKTRYEIIGVVAGTKNFTAGEDPQPQVFENLWQEGLPRQRIEFVMKSSLPPGGQLRALRDAVRRVEPAAGLEVATMFSSIGLAFLPSQIGAFLMGGTGVLGLLLAAIGIYGVLAFTVARRTREIGIRMAVGASRGEVGRLILREAGAMVGVGLLGGLVVALLVTRPLAMFLVAGLRTWDPWSFGGAGACLGLAALVAVAGPLRRALGVDPARCLRLE